MKKALSLLMVIAMLLTLCACGSSKPTAKKDASELTEEDLQAAYNELVGETEGTVETVPEEKVYNLGEKIILADGTIELTIDSFCFGEMVYPSEDNPDLIYFPTDDASRGKKARDGKIWLCYEATLNYLGDSKEAFQIDIPKNTLKLGDYEVAPGFLHRFLPITSRSNYVIYEPLMERTPCTIRGCAEVPPAVETSTDGDLVTNITVRYGPVSNLTSTSCMIKLR